MTQALRKTSGPEQIGSLSRSVHKICVHALRRITVFLPNSASSQKLPKRLRLQSGRLTGRTMSNGLPTKTVTCVSNSIARPLGAKQADSMLQGIRLQRNLFRRIRFSPLNT